MACKQQIDAATDLSSVQSFFEVPSNATLVKTKSNWITYTWSYSTYYDYSILYKFKEMNGKYIYDISIKLVMDDDYDGQITYNYQIDAWQSKDGLSGLIM